MSGQSESSSTPESSPTTMELGEVALGQLVGKSTAATELDKLVQQMMTSEEPLYLHMMAVNHVYHQYHGLSSYLIPKVVTVYIPQLHPSASSISCSPPTPSLEYESPASIQAEVMTSWIDFGSSSEPYPSSQPSPEHVPGVIINLPASGHASGGTQQKSSATTIIDVDKLVPTTAYDLPPDVVKKKTKVKYLHTLPPIGAQFLLHNPDCSGSIGGTIVDYIFSGGKLYCKYTPSYPEEHTGHTGESGSAYILVNIRDNGTLSHAPALIEATIIPSVKVRVASPATMSLSGEYIWKSEVLDKALTILED